jgi:hypothetical protein
MKKIKKNKLEKYQNSGPVKDQSFIPSINNIFQQGLGIAPNITNPGGNPFGTSIFGDQLTKGVFDTGQLFKGTQQLNQLETPLGAWGGDVSKGIENDVLNTYAKKYGTTGWKKTAEAWARETGQDPRNFEKLIQDEAGQQYDNTIAAQKTGNEYGKPLAANMAAMEKLTDMQAVEGLKGNKRALYDVTDEMKGMENKGIFQLGGAPQISALQQALGYKDVSPFKKLPSQTILRNMSADGVNITMDGVSKNLYLIPDKGRPVLAQGNSGEYYFPNANAVEEIPAMQDGGAPKAQNGLTTKVSTWLNPKNWFVDDYSDRKEFVDAFNSARADGEKEFLWNGKRYNTIDAMDDIELTGNVSEENLGYYKKLKEENPELFKTLNQGRRANRINFEGNRANFDVRPFTGNRYINLPEKSFGYTNFLGSLIAEVPHLKDKSLTGNPYAFGRVRAAYEGINDGEDVYNIPGTLEYNAHRLDEPGVAMQAWLNLPPDDIKLIQKHLGVKEDGYFGRDTYNALQDKYKRNWFIKEAKKKNSYYASDENQDDPIRTGKNPMLSFEYFKELVKDIPELKGKMKNIPSYQQGGPTNLQTPTEPTYNYLTDFEKLEYVKKLKGYVEKYGFESLAESDPKGAMFLQEQLELLSKGGTDPKDPPIVGGNVAEGEDIVITAKRKREGSNGEIAALPSVRERLMNPVQLEKNDDLFKEILEGFKEQKSAAQREQEYKRRLQLMFAEQNRQKEQVGSNISTGRGRFQSGGIPVLNLSKNINYKRLNPQGMYKFGGLITEGSEYDKREQPEKNTITGASSTGPMGPKDMPSYDGGIRSIIDQEKNEIIPTENLIPIQTEKGELIVLPTGDVVPVMAKKRHHQMDEDEVTDVAPEGAYILSSFGRVKIKKKEAENVIAETGVKPYKLGIGQETPTEKTLGDIMTKKEMAPAEVGKLISRRFPVIATDNPYEAAANTENKINRRPYLEGLIQLSEFDKMRKGIDTSTPEATREYREEEEMYEYEGENEMEGAEVEEMMQGGNPMFRRNILTCTRPTYSSCNTGG